MARHEKTNGACNWYTPKWVFDAIGREFDLDPCAGEGDFVPAKNRLFELGLEMPWSGTVWLNPPYGDKRHAIVPWLEKFVSHGDGIAIVPNRTATEWFQKWAYACDHLIFLQGKVKFIHQGKEGKSPGYGNVLGSMGKGTMYLKRSKLAGLRFSGLTSTCTKGTQINTTER